jgi:hypothetical protein
VNNIKITIIEISDIICNNYHNLGKPSKIFESLNLIHFLMQLNVNEPITKVASSFYTVISEFSLYTDDMKKSDKYYYSQEYENANIENELNFDHSQEERY